MATTFFVEEKTPVPFGLAGFLLTGSALTARQLPLILNGINFRNLPNEHKEKENYSIPERVENLTYTASASFGLAALGYFAVDIGHHILNHSTSLMLSNKFEIAAKAITAIGIAGVAAYRSQSMYQDGLNPRLLKPQEP